MRAAEIARQAAAQATKNMYHDATTVAKKQKLEKAVDKSGLFDDIYYENVCIMNFYKRKYGEKFNFNFRPRYTVDMKPDVIAGERKHFEILLNAQDLPTIMKDFICKLSESAEAVSIWVNSPYFNLASVAEKVKLNADSGYFDKELKQLSITWQSWLAREPEERLLWKLSFIFSKQIQENAGYSPQKSTPSKPPSKEYIQSKNKSKDL